MALSHDLRGCLVYDLHNCLTWPVKGNVFPCEIIVIVIVAGRVKEVPNHNSLPCPLLGKLVAGSDSDQRPDCSAAGARLCEAC